MVESVTGNFPQMFDCKSVWRNDFDRAELEINVNVSCKTTTAVVQYVII